jgi:Na+-transporting methylmalonyl-CoA/oxaloacetate decarboxylase gamma subunit
MIVYHSENNFKAATPDTRLLFVSAIGNHCIMTLAIVLKVLQILCFVVRVLGHCQTLTLASIALTEKTNVIFSD